MIARHRKNGPVVRYLSHFPSVHAIARRVANRLAPEPTSVGVPETRADLSLPAREVLLALEEANARRGEPKGMR